MLFVVSLVLASLAIAGVEVADTAAEGLMFFLDDFGIPSSYAVIEGGTMVTTVEGLCRSAVRLGSPALYSSYKYVYLVRVDSHGCWNMRHLENNMAPT